MGNAGFLHGDTMFLRYRKQTFRHLVGTVIATCVSAMFLTAAPVRADVSTDVTFYDALWELAYTAKENDVLVRRDNTRSNLESRPFATPAVRLMARIREQKTNEILWGFGDQMVSALGKILSLGGATTTAEILGLIKDAANSRSLKDFLGKAGPKKVWKKSKDHFKAMGEPDANAERFADKALERLFKKIKLAKKTKRIVSNTATGQCKGGSERLTVDLDIAKGEVVMNLQASHCTCSDKSDLKAYSGQVVGNFKPRYKRGKKKLNWKFSYRSSRFSGTPCSKKEQAIVAMWEKSQKGGGRTPLPKTPKPPRCTAATCIFLVRHLDLEEQVIQALVCRMAGLKREKREQSDEYSTVSGHWNQLSASLNGAFGEYAACKCDSIAGIPANIFRLRGFRDVLKRSVRPPYTPPKLPLSNKAYCPKCDPYRSWIGKWSWWGTVVISLRNGALHVDWKTTYGPANPIVVKVTYADATKLKADYEMSNRVKGTLELTLQPAGHQFQGFRTETGYPIKRSIAGNRIGDQQYCGR